MFHLVPLGSGNVHNSVLDFNPGRQLGTTHLVTHPTSHKRIRGEELKKNLWVETKAVKSGFYLSFVYREIRKNKRKSKKTTARKVMKKPKFFTIIWPTSRWTLSNASPSKLLLQFLLLNSISCVLQHLFCLLGSAVPTLFPLTSCAAPACLLVDQHGNWERPWSVLTIIIDTKYIIKFMLTLQRK